MNPSLSSFLELPLVSRIRRNHGLEHATLHILSLRHPGHSLAGYSDAGGFWLVGDLPTQAVQDGVQEALRRLHAGEARLAVHPNCGTNFVASGLFAGLAAFLAMLGAGKRMRDKLERFPLVVTVTTVALIFSQPLGLMLQERLTTCGLPGDMDVVSVQLVRRGRMPTHRIVTRG